MMREDGPACVRRLNEKHGTRYFKTHSLLPSLSEPQQALLRSQTGRNCARAFTAVPCDKAVRVAPERFRVALCRRLRLPLLLSEGRCEGCGELLDAFGDHYAACMRTGRVQARAKPVERAWEKVLKEAGATTHWQKLLRETTLRLANPLRDSRRTDVLATCLPLWHGRALLCDATVVSPLTARGEARPGTARRDGVALKSAERVKAQQEYPDVVSSDVIEFFVLATEVGGRWNDTATDLLDSLARHKAKTAPEALRRSVELAWADRWWATLGVAVQDALAASLLAPSGKKLVLDQKAAPEPELDQLLDAQRWAEE